MLVVFVEQDEECLVVLGVTMNVVFFSQLHSLLKCFEIGVEEAESDNQDE